MILGTRRRASASKVLRTTGGARSATRTTTVLPILMTNAGTRTGESNPRTSRYRSLRGPFLPLLLLLPASHMVTKTGPHTSPDGASGKTKSTHEPIDKNKIRLTRARLRIGRAPPRIVRFIMKTFHEVRMGAVRIKCQITFIQIRVARRFRRVARQSRGPARAVAAPMAAPELGCIRKGVEVPPQFAADALADGAHRALGSEQ